MRRALVCAARSHADPPAPECCVSRQRLRSLSVSSHHAHGGARMRRHSRHWCCALGEPEAAQGVCPLHIPGLLPNAVQRELGRRLQKQLHERHGPLVSFQGRVGSVGSYSAPYWVPHYSAGSLSTLYVRGASHDKWKFCSLQGSETNHQHKQRGFHYDSASGIASVGNRSLVYLHFQGSRKGDIARFSRSPVTTAGAVACEHLPSLLCRAWGSWRIASPMQSIHTAGDKLFTSHTKPVHLRRMTCLLRPADARLGWWSH